MGKEYESLPKGVQKLVKKLADVEREQLKVLRAHYPDEETRMMKLIEKGDKETRGRFYRFPWRRHRLPVSCSC